VDPLDRERIKQRQLEREAEVSRKMGLGGHAEYDPDAIKFRHHEREKEIFTSKVYSPAKKTHSPARRQASGSPV